MAGIGDVMLGHLTTVKQATTKELAALVPDKPFATVWSRLDFLERYEDRVKRVPGSYPSKEDQPWTLEGAKPFVAKRVGNPSKAKPAAGGEPQQATASVEGSAPSQRPAKAPLVKPEGLAFDRSHGWKPDLSRFKQPGSTPRKGDKLLVEYPEGWRHTALVTVTRDPDADGVALCWDIRNKMNTYVPVGDPGKHGVRLAIVDDERSLIALEGER